MQENLNNFILKKREIMTWKKQIKIEPYYGELRRSTVFAWLPIKCENGECAWLEKVNLVEEYTIGSSGFGHWVNKEFE